jgi:ketosteroid isomerase-like protein
MPGELNSVATDFFAALDALDADRMTQMSTEDVQSVDEISRRWLRGRGDVDNYLRELMPAVSDVETQLRDAEERIWGDTGLLT